LLELLLGMSITAVIGLSAAGVSRALSAKYTQGEDYYTSLQSTRIAMLRLRNLLQGSHLVTEATNTRLMMWYEPPGGDGQINLSELILIQYTSSDQTLCQYQVVFPVTMPPAQRLLLDTQIPLGNMVEQPDSWASTVRNNAYTQTTVLAGNIASFRAVADDSAPLTKMLSLYLTSGTGNGLFSLRGAACLRGDRTGRVGIVGGHYALL
jgi:hypothetical protein